MARLTGKAAIVTGAGGIGRTTALVLDCDETTVKETTFLAVEAAPAPIVKARRAFTHAPARPQEKARPGYCPRLPRPPRNHAPWRLHS